MSTLKVELTSREMIKPSSPTPNHLKTHQLSFLDQMAPPVYMSFIFFYPKNQSHPIDNNKEISSLLKRSLSDTLVRFYPLAGRLEGNNVTVSCNDEGVEYNEAYVSTNLSKVIENPNLDELRGLLPFGPVDQQNIVLGVQLNRFSCGGLGIGVSLSHKVADGKSFIDFVNSWATITRGIHSHDLIVLKPLFDSSSRFPPRDLNGNYTMESNISQEKIVTRRFLFNKSMLDVLKKEAIGDGWLSEVVTKPPTRVEVVSAFIWKRVMEAAQAKTGPGPTKISGALHAVNLRARMAPPIPEESFGNYWWFTVAPSLNGAEAKHSELVGKLRESITKIDKDVIKKIENGEIFLELKKAFENPSLVPETCNFTTCCRFPIYEVDFGWGKPIWVGPPILPSKNLAILLNTSCGKGIEAWINMFEDDIELLQRDHHLLSLPQVPRKELSLGSTMSLSSYEAFRSSMSASLTSSLRRLASQNPLSSATSFSSVTSMVGFSSKMSTLFIKRLFSITKRVK